MFETVGTWFRCSYLVRYIAKHGRHVHTSIQTSTYVYVYTYIYIHLYFFIRIKLIERLQDSTVSYQSLPYLGLYWACSVLRETRAAE